MESAHCLRISALTPRHLFRQLDPSWFLNGQTTSLLASDAENELVSEFLGGMPGGSGSGDRLSAAKRVQQGSAPGIYMVTMRLLRDQLA